MRGRAHHERKLDVKVLANVTPNQELTRVLSRRKGKTASLGELGASTSPGQLRAATATALPRPRAPPRGAADVPSIRGALQSPPPGT